MTWRHLGADELEFQFNPRRSVPAFEAHQAANAQLSAEVRARLERHLDLAYGETPLQKVDLFPAAPRGREAAPIHVFFHGGYWRAQDKANFAFVAEHLGPDEPSGATELYKDPDLGFVVLAHVNRKPSKNTPHDHGPSWAVYGMAYNFTDMTSTAASRTAQMSMPRSWANIASSLTSATLTCRKVFSRSLVSSATLVCETDTTLSTRSE